MHRFAVIDIGSNSVRLMFVADGKVLYKVVNTTRLGEGIAQTPVLKTEAIERSAQAVAAFYRQAKGEGAEGVFAFATAAVRTAENGAAFVARVRELCGLAVEVISGESEAELGITGALGNADGAVLDIGGASTELVVRRVGEVIYKRSVDVGVVRLKDRCGRSEIALREAAERAAKDFGEVPENMRLHVIGGTATTIAAQILRLAKYDSEKITGAEIRLDTLREKTQEWLAMPVERLAALPCMPSGRADVFVGGAMLLTVLLERFGLQACVACDRDNLEGYAVKRGLADRL